MDKYEKVLEGEAASVYTQELRAKLQKHYDSKAAVPDFIPLKEGERKWKLGITSLEGGKKLKTLLASRRLVGNEAVIELVGKYQLSSGFTPHT